MSLLTLLQHGSPAVAGTGRLRGLAWLALSDLGQLGVSTTGADGGGGSATAWTYGASMPCRIAPLVGNESVAAARLSDRSTHVVTVPAWISVTIANRFAIVGVGTFEVTVVRSRTGQPLTVFEVVQII